MKYFDVLAAEAVTKTADRMTSDEIFEIKKFYALEQMKRDRFTAWAEKLEVKASNCKEPAICKCGDPATCPRTAEGHNPEDSGEDESMVSA